MTERDWRIFREDFSIAYKGNAGGTLPIRNWAEAALPEPLMRVRLSWPHPRVCLNKTPTVPMRSACTSFFQAAF